MGGYGLMPNYSDEETRTLTKEMSDKIYNDSYSTTEEELKTDTNWIEATKSVYKELEGVEWSGADEDAAKTGLDLMSRFNYNLTLGTINYTAKLQDADPKTKLAFYYMMDMYDKKDISGNGVMRAFKEMGLDPASYIGIGTLGMGFVGKQAAATTAKTGLKAMLKQGAIKFLQSPTAVAATEGAIYTGVDDIARQDAAIGAGVQDEYSPGQTALATGIGAAAGAGIVQGTKAIGRGISNVVNEQENVLRKNFEEGGSLAGGGTPPKIEPEGDMIIQHNLSQENLQHADKMGGLPVPSLAITNKGTPLEGFGDITMLGDKDLAKPTREHKVFGADIYSPRYPTVKHNLTTKAERDISNELTQFEELTGSKGLDFENIYNNTALKAKFLTEKGIEVPQIMREVDPVKKEQYEAFADIADKYQLNREYVDDPEFMQRAKQYYLDKGFAEDDPLMADEKFNRLAKALIQQVKQTSRSMSDEGEVDQYLTQSEINSIVNKQAPEFKAYVDDYLQSHGAKEVIYKGTDNQGRQKWIPHTMDNVVKKLKADLRGGEDFNYGIGSTRAKYTPQFKTLKQIQASKDKLVDSKTFDKIKEEINDEFSGISDDLSHYYKYDTGFGFMDTITGLLRDAADTSIERELQEYGFENVPAEMVERLKGFQGALKDMPTEYFESKMLKQMDLGEFKVAVIPNNASDMTKQILEKKGIEYTTYDPGLDGDRIKQIQQTAEKNGYLFSLPASLGLAAAATQGENNDNN
jgi:hypothetical protein